LSLNDLYGLCPTRSSVQSVPLSLLNVSFVHRALQKVPDSLASPRISGHAYTLLGWRLVYVVRGRHLRLIYSGMLRCVVIVLIIHYTASLILLFHRRLLSGLAKGIYSVAASSNNELVLQLVSTVF